MAARAASFGLRALAGSRPIIGRAGALAALTRAIATICGRLGISECWPHGTNRDSGRNKDGHNRTLHRFTPLRPLGDRHIAMAFPLIVTNTTTPRHRRRDALPEQPSGGAHFKACQRDAVG